MSGPDNLRGILGRPGFELLEYDCRDTARLARDFADVGGIMHLAACKIPRFGGALNTMHVNVDGSQAAFDVALELDVPIVFTSTSDVYGNAETPFREDGEIVLGPPTSRRWSYAASKYFDEHLALRMHEEHGLKVSILRLFNAYGSATTRAGGAARSPCSSRTSSTASRWRSTATASRSARSRT